MQKLEGSRVAIALLSMEMPTSLWVMISASAWNRGSVEIMVGQGTWLQWRWRLDAMEHEAGIEWVTGHRLESGCRYGSGHKSGFGY